MNAQQIDHGRHSDDNSLALRGALAVGFLALAAGVIAAHFAPATRYEVSMYAATPPAFWVGAGVALAVALVAGFHAAGRLRAVALLLGGMALFAVAALPVLRGYYYYGAGDALSHLGWARDVQAGRTSPLGLLYPGVHVFGLLVHAATEASLPRSLVLVVLTYVATFVTFVTLTVRIVTQDSRAAVVAAFSAFLLLPINGISAFMTPHPATMAILFVPVPLALLAVYVREPQRTFSALGVLLAVCSVSVVLLHPQQAANLLVVLATLSAIQFVGRRVTDARIDPDTSAAGGFNRLYGQTAFLGVVFVIWSLRYERTSSALGALVNFVLNPRLTGGEIQQRGQAVATIGGSLPELFVKLFLVAAIYAGLAGLLVLASFSGRLDRQSRGSRLVKHFGAGLFPVGGVFLLYFAASLQTMYFRHFSFLMVLVTVLGAVAIHRATEFLRGRTTPSGRRAVTLATSVAIAAMLVVSLVTLFPSPFVYQPNNQVAHAEVDGYQVAFAHASPDAPFLGVRTGPDRFRDGLTGTGELDSRDYRRATGVNFTALEDGLRNDVTDETYLTVTRSDRVREVVSFHELRYTEDELSRIGAEPWVNRVGTNGEFELYYATHPAGSDSGAPAE